MSDGYALALLLYALGILLHYRLGKVVIYMEKDEKLFNDEMPHVIAAVLWPFFALKYFFSWLKK